MLHDRSKSHHSPKLALIAAIALAVFSRSAFAGPVFYSTANSSNWQVATSQGGTDGLFASFPTAGFVTATSVIGRPDFIANNSTGTNGNIGNWTFFVFRQTVDLTGFDASTAVLSFQWAADDSGEGVASRGLWS